MKRLDKIKSEFERCISTDKWRPAEELQQRGLRGGGTGGRRQGHARARQADQAVAQIAGGWRRRQHDAGESALPLRQHEVISHVHGVSD